jgi:hypothetical protein
MCFSIDPNIRALPDVTTVYKVVRRNSHNAQRKFSTSWSNYGREIYEIGKETRINQVSPSRTMTKHRSSKRGLYTVLNLKYAKEMAARRNSYTTYEKYVVLKCRVNPSDFLHSSSIIDQHVTYRAVTPIAVIE